MFPNLSWISIKVLVFFHVCSIFIPALLILEHFSKIKASFCLKVLLQIWDPMLCTSSKQKGRRRMNQQNKQTEDGNTQTENFKMSMII